MSDDIDAIRANVVRFRLLKNHASGVVRERASDCGRDNAWVLDAFEREYVDESLDAAIDAALESHPLIAGEIWREVLAENCGSMQAEANLYGWLREQTFFHGLSIEKTQDEAWTVTIFPFTSVGSFDWESERLEQAVDETIADMSEICHGGLLRSEPGGCYFEDRERIMGMAWVNPDRS